jgi:hypothetical protein
MKGLGFEPRDREREKARGELIFQFYSKRVRAERQSNHNSKAMVPVQILQLELPKALDDRGGRLTDRPKREYARFRPK